MGLMGSEQLESLVEAIKTKVRKLKKGGGGRNSSSSSSSSKIKNKAYVKMDKSASVKMEIRSRKARRLIDQTLEAADRPGKTAIPS